jgi:hypothetical protein
VIEREDIINSIQKNLWDVDGVALVERNLRQLANPSEFPAIFIIDLGDEVEVPTSRPIPEYKRIWEIMIVSILQGTSEETAINELATFQTGVKAAMYRTSKTVGRQYKGFITEGDIEPIAFLNIGNNVVAQGLHFEIHYVSSLANL